MIHDRELPAADAPTATNQSASPRGRLSVEGT
jgi:hypothetical protein